MTDIYISSLFFSLYGRSECVCVPTLPPAACPSSRQAAEKIITIICVLCPSCRYNLETCSGNLKLEGMNGAIKTWRRYRRSKDKVKSKIVNEMIIMRYLWIVHLLLSYILPQASIKIPYPVLVWREMSLGPHFKFNSSPHSPDKTTAPPTTENVVEEDRDFEQGAFHMKTIIASKPLDVFRVLADVENYKAWGGTGIKGTEIVECSAEDAVADIFCGAFGFSFHLRCNGKFQQAHNSTLPHKVSFKLLHEVPFIKSFEARYSIEPSDDVTSTVSNEVKDDVECNSAHTKLKFSSVVRFSGMIPKFVQLSMKNLVNEIAVGELKKYCEDGRMQEDFLLRPIPRSMTLQNFPRNKKGTSRFRLPFPLPRVDFRKATPVGLVKGIICIFVNDNYGEFNLPGLPPWLNIFRTWVYPNADNIYGSESKSGGIWNETMSPMPHSEMAHPHEPSEICKYNAVSTLFVFVVQNLFTLSMNPVMILEKMKRPKRTYTDFMDTLKGFQAMIHDHDHPHFDTAQKGVHDSHHYDQNNSSKSNTSSNLSG